MWLSLAVLQSAVVACFCFSVQPWWGLLPVYQHPQPAEGAQQRVGHTTLPAVHILPPGLQWPALDHSGQTDNKYQGMW
jgi:hypothetical protein